MGMYTLGTHITINPQYVMLYLYEFTYYVTCIYLSLVVDCDNILSSSLLSADVQVAFIANSMGQDQTFPRMEVRSGFIVFTSMIRIQS